VRGAAVSNLQPGCRGSDVDEAALGECCHVCGFSIDINNCCDCEEESMDEVMTYKEAFCELARLAAQRGDTACLTVECWIRPAGTQYGVRGLVRSKDEVDLQWQIYSEQAREIFSAPTASEAVKRYRLGLGDEIADLATRAHIRLVGKCDVEWLAGGEVDPDVD